ncbi:MAG: universal stress protein [Hydrogenophaga sp.]|uniref:universal stress protein n=1 Tax=Hydrogenophaga sp. TaxID=1904254 RepID=UPI002730DFFC|nr:universal stress protein [Hydrogenophaga sp.]MDP2162866.1 universal stress protein [Hydrogenophaga sp.]MDP3474410.1 universal stress protein [Hydrogenophaga sp.]
MLKILIPTDGSEHALLAVHHALELVNNGLQASFVVANVQDTATLYEMMVAHDPSVLQAVNEGAGQDLMRPAVALLEAAGQAVEQDVATGDAAQMLVDIAERHGCDAIILSARGTGSLRAAVMGSVSHELLHSSPVPVTVVKAVEAAEVDQDEQDGQDGQDGQGD